METKIYHIYPGECVSIRNTNWILDQQWQDTLTLRSAPALELNRVAVVTRLFNGSTAPTATSGVSITASSFGGRTRTAGSFRKSLMLMLGLGVGREFVLRDSDDAREPALRLDARDFRLSRGEFVELESRDVCFRDVGEAIETSVGEEARLEPFFLSVAGGIGGSSHSRCRITFFVAH